MAGLRPGSGQNGGVLTGCTDPLEISSADFCASAASVSMVLKALSSIACNEPSVPIDTSFADFSGGANFAGFRTPLSALGGGVILELSRPLRATGILGIALTGGSRRRRRFDAAAICSAARDRLVAASSNLSIGAVRGPGAGADTGAAVCR